jgi:NADP-dependent 3-hydroxy acid dehydrogenase YdfG
MSLTDRVVVITGASSGIGAAVARDLHAAGMKLVVSARRQDRLDRLCAELPGSVALAGDILEPSLPQRLLDLALKSFGRCDALVNNAGILEVAPLDRLDIERVAAMVRLNVEAAYRVAYLAVQHFLRAGCGHLVNTSSVLGVKTRPTAGWYAGTKFAIEALSESLRMELAGSGVKVSCIEPGLVTTELHQHWETPPAQRLNIRVPLQPVDVARCVRFVLDQPGHVLIPRLMILPADQAI